MNHPPNIQIDHFGVWSLELDFSLVQEGGQLRAVVGHEGPGDATCWGYYLLDFLRMIAPKRIPSDPTGTSVLRYRPVFINFDIKDWGIMEGALAIGRQDLELAFGRENVIDLAEYLQRAAVDIPLFQK